MYLIYISSHCLKLFQIFSFEPFLVAILISGVIGDDIGGI